MHLEPQGPAAEKSTGGPRRRGIFRRRWFSEMPRWKCWTCRLAVGLPLIGAVLAVVLTQTVILKGIMLPALEGELGLSIEADWVYVGRTGGLTMRDVVVRSPAVSGPAGKLLQVRILRADVDWWSVLQGRPRLTEVRLLDPLVRLSQSVSDESLNFASLPAPAPGSGTGPPADLPRIVGTRIALELGEHGTDSYTILKRLNLEGSLVPSRGPGARQYDVRLHESSPRRGRPGISVSGLLDDTSLDIEMTGLVLDDWPAAAAPSPVRRTFSNLDLKGDIVSTRFQARDGKWSSLRIELADVAVNLPLEQERKEREAAAPVPPMRMSGVSGDISFRPEGVAANLKGRIEDLPYTVTLRFDGLSPDAPFSMDIVSENFQIAKNPDLLPYAPPLVRKRFMSFSSPTGEVDTRMTVTRGPPDAEGPAPIRIGGLVNFSNVDAAYDRFPYRFSNLSGVVRFDDEGIDLVRVTGTAPSGAKVFATGRIAPPTSAAEVTLNIDVTDIPLDEKVQAALGGERGELIPAIFNPQRYDDLVRRGLILTPARAADLRAEAASCRAAGDDAGAAAAEAALATPEFAIGGTGRVHVNLHRPLGDDSEWYTTIDVSLRQAGLLVEAFPLPVIARDVVLRVDDDRADLVSGRFRTLTGAEADVALFAALHDPKTGEKDFRPDVRVSAHDVPVEALFLAALPRGADLDDGRPLVQSILSGLGVGGRVNADAHVLHREDGPLGFDVHVDFAKAEMHPPSGGEPIRVTGLIGAADISERRLDLSVEGGLRLSGDVAAGRIGVVAGVSYSTDAADRRWAYDAAIHGTGIAAAAPIEDIVRAFSDSTADAMAARRAELLPEGVVDADTQITGSSETPVAARVVVSQADDIRLTLLGGRIGLTQATGRVEFSLGAAQPVIAEFQDLDAAMTFNAEPAGMLKLRGTYDFGDGHGTDLAVELSEAAFESALTRHKVGERLGRTVSDWWGSAHPRGRYDLLLALKGSAGAPVRTTGELRPRSFAFGVTEPSNAVLLGPPLEVSLDEVRGSIFFGPEGGRAESLEGAGSGLSASGEGQWTVFGEGDYSAAGSARLRAPNLSSELRAVLPRALRDAMDAVLVRVDGPVSLTDGKFSIASRSAPGGESAGARQMTADYSGVVAFKNAGIEAGLKVTGMDGSLQFEAEQPPGGGPIRYDLSVRADRLAASGVTMTSGRARISSGNDEGEVVVPLVSAWCHGGRVVGQGRVGGADSEGRRRFDTSAQWSGLRFAPVMADLAAIMKGDATPASDDDISRGLLEGEVSLAGVVGDEQSRRGRGTLRIAGGRVLSFPLVMQLIEVSNLALPVNAALDYARASMVIDGDQVVFEDLSVFSSAVSLLGYGRMSWPETELDLRFRSRGALQIPIISRLIEGLRDELIGTSVRGTLAKPVVALEQFPETRRLLDRAFGQEPAESEREMDEIRRRSKKSDPPSPIRQEPVKPSDPATDG